MSPTPAHRPPAPGSGPTDTSRPLLWLVAALVLAVVGAAVLWNLPRTDTPTSKEASAEQAAAEQARVEFSQTFAPTEDVAVTLIAPPTREWWTVVRSLGNELGLTLEDPPVGAEWLAFSNSATHTTSSDFPSYQAVYIGFATVDQARDFRAGEDCVCGRLVRANVVTLVSAQANPADEAFKFVEQDDAEELHLTPRAGAWTINVAEYVRQFVGTEKTNRYHAAHRQFFTALGATTEGPMTWSATSSTPEGPWAGKLEGFDTDNVDIFALGSAIGSTMVDECTGNICTGTDLGLLQAGSRMIVTDGVNVFGDDQWADPEWREQGPPEDTLIAGGMDAETWESELRGLGSNEPIPMRGIYWRVTTDRDLIVTFDLDTDTP